MYLFCINLAHVSDSGPFLYKKGILILCLFCAYFVPKKCAYFVLFFGMGGRDSLEDDPRPGRPAISGERMCTILVNRLED